jgi:hypothetical protein
MPAPNPRRRRFTTLAALLFAAALLTWPYLHPLLSSLFAPGPVEVHLSQLLADPDRHRGQRLAVRGRVWDAWRDEGETPRVILGGLDRGGRLECRCREVTFPRGTRLDGLEAIAVGVLTGVDGKPVLEDCEVRVAP